MIGRVTEPDGSTIGTINNNLILDTMIFGVMFNDGSTQEYAVNRIALSIYDHVNEEGDRTRLLDSIGRHLPDESALKVSDGHTKDSRGKRSRKVTKKSRNLLAKWRDSSMSWIPLSDLNESTPLDITEYALANKISKEPSFSWWTLHTLKKETPSSWQFDRWPPSRTISMVSRYPRIP